MFILILYIIKIILLPLSKTKEQFIVQLLIQQKELSLCKRRLALQNKRIRFSHFDKIFFSIINTIFSKATSYITLVKPETVLRWTRKLIKNFWTFPHQKKKSGRPSTPLHIKQLVLKMKNQNLNWGYLRISSELKKLGIDLDKNTVRKIIKEYRRKGMVKCGLSWKRFIKSHMDSLYSMDFFTVDTVLHARLYVFFIIHLGTRKIVQSRITDHPTSFFVKNQLRSFMEDHDGEKAYMVHDNDGSFNYIDYDSLGIRDLRISVKAPDMNAYAERFIGSIRREALDWYVLFTERQVEKIIKEYIFYYNNYRMHQGIETVPGGYTPQTKGKVASIPVLSGLHHHYYRKAA
jgi:transposase InsO family protein